MRSMVGSPSRGVELIEAGLAALADADPAESDGAALAEQLQALHRLAGQLAAQFTLRVAVFHALGDAGSR